MSNFPPDHVCVVAGCERTAPRSSMCDMHRKRMSRHGTPGPAEPHTHTPRPCGIPGCESPHAANGLCKMHYMRAWRKGLACPPIGLFDRRTRRYRAAGGDR